MNEINDSELYSQLLNGSQEAFKSFYELYSTSLFRFIYRFTGNSESAEEILHDVFVELLNGKFKYHNNSSLKSWLFTLARNKSLNFIKKNSHEIVDLLTIENSHSELDLENQTVNNNLFQKLAHSETSLPEDLKKTWDLRKAGYNHFQIAQTLAMPVGTVKSRFHRLIEYLRKDFSL